MIGDIATQGRRERKQNDHDNDCNNDRGRTTSDSNKTNIHCNDNKDNKTTIITIEMAMLFAGVGKQSICAE